MISFAKGNFKDLLSIFTKLSKGTHIDIKTFEKLYNNTNLSLLHTFDLKKITNFTPVKTFKDLSSKIKSQDLEHLIYLSYNSKLDAPVIIKMADSTLHLLSNGDILSYCLIFHIPIKILLIDISHQNLKIKP